MSPDEAALIQLGDRIRIVSGATVVVAEIKTTPNSSGPPRLSFAASGGYSSRPLWWPASCVISCEEAATRFRIAKNTPEARVRYLPPSVVIPPPAPPAARVRVPEPEPEILPDHEGELNQIDADTEQAIVELTTLEEALV